MNVTFEVDEHLTKVAEAYTLDVIDMVGPSLDLSPQSINVVEATLETYAQTLTEANPTEEQVMQIAKGFGSYLGEVIRKHHGGQWGQITLDGKTAPGLKCVDGAFIWPWARVFNRLTKGASENVAHYFTANTRGL